MIPTIEEIVAGLVSGQYKAKQATAWLNTHISLAAESAKEQAEQQCDPGLRAMYSGLAMHALIMSRAHPSTEAGRKNISETSFLMADQMLEDGNG